ncbi:hypothetical protein B0H13DRAFT_1883410 [Mycena leptocephala]|nr:hypothetical protein B0H13DRAFT_1883410 [Mycena leptocephala]
MPDTRVPPKKRGYIACRNCRRRKVKCITDEYEGKPCQKCIQEGLKCEYVTVEQEQSASLRTHDSDPSGITGPGERRGLCTAIELASRSQPTLAERLFPGCLQFSDLANTGPALLIIIREGIHIPSLLPDTATKVRCLRIHTEHNQARNRPSLCSKADLPHLLWILDIIPILGRKVSTRLRIRDQVNAFAHRDRATAEDTEDNYFPTQYLLYAYNPRLNRKTLNQLPTYELHSFSLVLCPYRLMPRWRSTIGEAVGLEVSRCHLLYEKLAPESGLCTVLSAKNGLGCAIDPFRMTTSGYDRSKTTLLILAWSKCLNNHGVDPGSPSERRSASVIVKLADPGALAVSSQDLERAVRLCYHPSSGSLSTRDRWLVLGALDGVVNTRYLV